MKKRNKTIKAYEKLLRKDRDWDYGYLLSLEKHKLKRMFNYFSESNISEEDSTIAKEIALCIKLLDIIEEEDWASKEFSKRISESCRYSSEKLSNGNSRLKVDYSKPIKYPRYVNYRNESRFIPGRRNPIKELIDRNDSPGVDKDRNLDLIELHKQSLRQLKALHLYHKIREYKIFKWWN